MNILTDLHENVNITVSKRDLLALIDVCFTKAIAKQIKQFPEHLSIKQLAEYLNYSEAAIYKMVANAEIPNYKLSGKLLFKKIEIDNWLIDFRQPTIKVQLSELNTKCK